MADALRAAPNAGRRGVCMTSLPPDFSCVARPCIDHQTRVDGVVNDFNDVKVTDRYCRCWVFAFSVECLKC